MAWQTAVRLVARGHKVDVLTTCSAAFQHDWSQNTLPPGETEEDGVRIHRFPVNRRNGKLFGWANGRVLAVPKERLFPGLEPVSKRIEKQWIANNIHSTSLETHLQKNLSDYTAVLILPYLYGTSFRAVDIAGEKAWLQPCLHDEAYAYFGAVAQSFRTSGRLLFNSEGEAALAAQLYGPMVLPKSEVVGSGIEFELFQNEGKASLPSGVEGSEYVLCLGRRSPEKGVDNLLAGFRAYRLKHPTSLLKLVLAGPGEKDYSSPQENVIDLGLVSEEEKVALLRGMIGLCQPSENESFSRVMFEAWHCEKPVIVHANCLATAVAVESSQGGWTAATEQEWAEKIETLSALDSVAAKEMGKTGKKYTEQFADWDRTIDYFETLLADQEKEVPKTYDFTQVSGIHQFLAGFAYGDAISNEALFIRNWLRSLGVRSEIYAGGVNVKMRHEGHHYTKDAVEPTDAVIYHHSIGNIITEGAIDHPGPKCLIYHNITPPEFFEPYDTNLAELLRQGRKDMRDLASSFPISVGDSQLNRDELVEFGFSSPTVLPLPIDPNNWAGKPNGQLLQQLSDGKRNLLFVGRLSPNKCQHHLIEVFSEYRSLDPDARLILVGIESSRAYLNLLQAQIAHYGLAGHVILTGHVDDGELEAYYKTAHLFLSLSEHEGFCVPLIEAMWFDVPVLAYKSTAIPETLGEASVLLTDKSNPVKVAALAKLVATDPNLRNKLIRQQRKERNRFLPKNIEPRIAELVERMLQGHR